MKSQKSLSKTKTARYEAMASRPLHRKTCSKNQLEWFSFLSAQPELNLNLNLIYKTNNQRLFLPISGGRQGNGESAAAVSGSAGVAKQ